MAESKEAYVNAAKHGSPNPPPRTRGRAIGPYCMVCTILKITTTILIIFGIMALILWLVFQPADLKVYVENASLTQFNLTGNNTLTYNLTLDMSFRNPNKKLGVYFEHIEAQALFGGLGFGDVTLPRFYQGHKSTTMLYPVFLGKAVAIRESVVRTFNREKGEGYFYISVKLYTKVRLKVIAFKSIKYSPEVDCALKLPVPWSGNLASGGKFMRTKCDVDDFS